MTAMWHALKRVGADVYYQHTSDVMTTIVAMFCRVHDRRSIYSAASDMDFVPGREEIGLGRDRWIFRFGLKRMDHIVVQNPAQQRECMRVYRRESTLIPSCYVPPEDARADRGGYVLWVARMGASKRPQLALDIARRLPQYRFVIVGGPRDDHAQFRAIERAAAALPNVELAGFLPHAGAAAYFHRAPWLV